jgi:Tfp pilus assembly protein FimV
MTDGDVSAAIVCGIILGIIAAVLWLTACRWLTIPPTPNPDVTPPITAPITPDPPEVFPPEGWESKGGFMYTIQPGDNLWDISEKVYGDPTMWTVIYWTNFREGDPTDLIHNGGNRLWIPSRIVRID